jgi:hypothetical protein
LSLPIKIEERKLAVMWGEKEKSCYTNKQLLITSTTEDSEKIREKIKFKDELKFLLKLLKKFALSEKDGCFEN